MVSDRGIFLLSGVSPDEGAEGTNTIVVIAGLKELGKYEITSSNLLDQPYVLILTMFLTLWITRPTCQGLLSLSLKST